jgi:NCAIR mutase (PurE)-related protein
MQEEKLRALLEAVKSGTLSSEEAIEQLRKVPYEELGFAKLDHHRHLRRGFPEVIFAQSKTPEQVAILMQRMVAYGSVAMATRVSPEMAEQVQAQVPGAEYRQEARILVAFPEGETWPDVSARASYIAVCTGGTTDIPVAEEAAVTAELTGHRVERVYDVGVAGIHRLISHLEVLTGASVLIAVAGMEGALPSVLGGIVSVPVLAVPTSVGYGASFGGLAALLAMLNSCATGISVFNIDNGFGAGYFASLIDKA